MMFGTTHTAIFQKHGNHNEKLERMYQMPNKQQQKSENSSTNELYGRKRHHRSKVKGQGERENIRGGGRGKGGGRGREREKS